jgi:hypothetical protein
MSTGELHVDITQCARCTGNHAALLFVPFRHPFSLTWTHWAMCPTNGEPILLRIVGGTDNDTPATETEGT